MLTCHNHYNKYNTSTAPEPVLSCGTGALSRRPTYTCPNPPLPNFLSTLYDGEVPTWTCYTEAIVKHKHY